MSTSQQMLSASQEKIPYYLEAKCNINGTQSRDLKMCTSIKVCNARMALQKSFVEEDHKVPVDIILAGSKEKNCISSAVHIVFIPRVAIPLCEKTTASAKMADMA